MSYEEFLRAKAPVVPDAGLPGDHELNPALFPFQRDIVRWALRKGRCAVFADCGLGKTIQQLSWAQVVAQKAGPVLVLAPLAVAQQTVAEGARFGIPCVYAREMPADLPPITVTNYEMLHRFDASRFAGVVLDESSILKAFDGKTRNAIVSTFARTPYRLACTATPAPNDHQELGNHAEFLGVMSRVEMLASFFVHDGGDTSVWRLKGHAQTEFWRWVCSWAVMLRNPSDLEYSDDGFRLPAMTIHEHVVRSSRPTDGFLFAMPAETLQDQRAARRTTLVQRVETVASLVAAEPDEPWIVWCELNAEGDALTGAIPGAVQIAGADALETKESRMHGFTGGAFRVLVSKPSICGHGMNWQHCARMAFVGLSHSWEQFYQAIRRVWRFGQTRPVEIHVVSTDLEIAVLQNVQRKQKDADRMASEMLAHMHAGNLADVRGASRQTECYTPRRAMRVPAWLLESAREDAA